MCWTKRLLIALPIAIAAALNVLMIVADQLHLHREHIEGYGFLFALPWAWLLDRSWFANLHNRLLEAILGYFFMLWIPASLYSVCLWLLVAGIKSFAARRSA